MVKETMVARLMWQVVHAYERRLLERGVVHISLRFANDNVLQMLYNPTEYSRE